MSKVQSYDVILSYLPMLSCVVDFVPAPVLNWDYPLTRTPHFCRENCDRWNIHHKKEPLGGIWLLGMCPTEQNMIHSVGPCQHLKVHSRKLGSEFALSNLSSRGLALLTMAYQAVMTFSVNLMSFSHSLCFLSLTLPRMNAHFFQSSPVQWWCNLWWNLKSF